MPRNVKKDRYEVFSRVPCMRFEFKQCLVARADLQISTGKLAAQIAHAAVGSAEAARKTKRGWYRGWASEGQKKVVLLANSLDHLLSLETKAKAMKLPTALIKDMGMTELPAGTVTALGIGPAPEELIDRVTSSLPLLK